MPSGDANAGSDDPGPGAKGDGAPAKAKIPYPIAYGAAQNLLHRLRDCGLFRNAEIAGSLRRGIVEHPTVGDVEIVAEWRTYSKGREVFLDRVLSAAGVERAPDRKGRKAPWGSRYRRGLIRDINPIPVDLFLVYPPATWGLIYLIRTGSAKFSQGLVTRLHHYGLRAEEGRVVDTVGNVQATPDEEAVFALAHMPVIGPAQREPGNRALDQYFGSDWWQ